MASNVKINQKQLEIALSKPTEAATIGIARQMARDKFKSSLGEFTKEILTDPMSQEIMAGPDLKKSKFIKGIGSRKYGGNLFSFIGFLAGDEPIRELINYIKSSSKVNSFNVRLIKNKYTFKVTAPTEADVKGAFPFPDGVFGSRSWITGLEKGISNVINYIRKSGQGRSTGGIQIKGSIDKTFKNKKGFFSDKYKKFIRNLNR